MKILHTADIHIKDYQDERWYTLKDLIEVGRKENIDVLVICGDLFDKSWRGDILRGKIRELFNNINFQVLILPGNHDIKAYETGMYFGENVNLITPSKYTHKIKGITFCGIPFEELNREETLKKLNNLKKELPDGSTNILLYHGELMDGLLKRNDFGEEGDKRYMPVKLSDFKDLNVRYILAGHFHSKFEVKSIDGNKFFVYSGSPISITRKELGQRAVNLFEVGENPRDYFIDTFHYKNLRIELNPYENKTIDQTLDEHYKNIHPKAKIILTIDGYFNKKSMGLTEEQLKIKIEEKFAGKYVEPWEFCCSDIEHTLSDMLFQRFAEKLKNLDPTKFTEAQKKKMLDLAIQAMMRSKI